MTFLDVGHGDSILAEFPGSEKMLIDGGGLPVGNFDIGESVVSPFLWSKGIRRLAIIVLTHPHPDHRNGLPALARNFRPREFWEASPPASDAGAEVLRRALGTAARRTPQPGEKRTIAGVEIEVLAPGPSPPPRAGRENDRSLTLRVTYGRVSFLLPGDNGEASERILLQSGRPLRSTVLKSPHHGSRTSSSPAFLAAVSPEIVVISVGRDNRYGLPDPAVVARYAGAGARVYRTDWHGAVEIVTDGERLAVHTAEVAAGGENKSPGKVIDSPDSEAYDFAMTAFRKVICVFGAAALTLSLGFGQSVVDAAKKEKERRDGQQGKRAVTVTNATLSAVKKKPAVTTEAAEVLPAGGDAAVPGTKAPAAAAKPAPLPGPEPQSPPPVEAEDQKADLQAKYDRAKERVELLNLKMLSLRQQLTTFNSMQTKDQVQKDMAETYQRLLEAQTDAVKAKEDLDKFLSQQAKEKSSSIWIR